MIYLFELVLNYKKLIVFLFVFQLKDLDDLELKREIENYKVKFELESMMNTKSKHLSGGMKRKLSVAIALIGKSKVLFLDQ